MCTVNLFVILYVIPNYLYSRFLVFVQALHFISMLQLAIHLILSLKQICYLTALIKAS